MDIKEIFGDTSLKQTMLIPLSTSGNVVTPEQFWSGILVYYNRPHLANKKIIGTKQYYIYQLNYDEDKIKDVTEQLSYTSVLYDARRIKEYNESNLYSLVENLIKPFDKTATLIAWDKALPFTLGVYVSIRVLIGRKNNTQCVEVILINKDKNLISFTASCENEREKLLAPPFQYIFTLNETGHVQLNVQDFKDADTPSAEWLVEKLFEKIMKWMENEFLSNVSGNTFLKIPKESLSLIDIEEYTELYDGLKVKYGNRLINIWCEKTDPLKFVYEDIAISAYLICFWKRYSSKTNPSFVDLGCGNGLLVYILNQEGYPGIGIDVRKRNIWDMYDPKVNLIVRTITPSDEHLFPNTDWIIGNHSDELTPWIPVISARSSYNTNFFLLPCCCFELNGSKFQRRNTSHSSYTDYLQYISEFCEKLGFIVKLDKLRIPSTKRICLVNVSREYSEDLLKTNNMRIQEIIDEKTARNTKKGITWIDNFKARSDKEEIRNCTQIDRILTSNIIDTIVEKLLSKPLHLKKNDGANWNGGSQFHLKELIACLKSSELNALKQQHGGLQTLLKNHRYIFETSPGYVQLRKPPQNTKENKKYCEKICWFHKNHPNGCLYSLEECACIHEGGCNKKC